MASFYSRRAGNNKLRLRTAHSVGFQSTMLLDWLRLRNQNVPFLLNANRDRKSKFHYPTRRANGVVTRIPENTNSSDAGEL